MYRYYNITQGSPVKQKKFALPNNELRVVMSALAQKIKALRNDKGLTLDELAKITGSSKSYIWELENKSISKPSADKLAKIASALGVTTEYLIGNEKKNALMEAKDSVFINKYKSLSTEEKEKIIKLIELFEIKK